MTGLGPVQQAKENICFMLLSEMTLNDRPWKKKVRGTRTSLWLSCRVLRVLQGTENGDQQRSQLTNRLSPSQVV